MIYLYELDKLYEGEVLSRPSKKCKTPYVADVLINDQTTEENLEVIAHSPSLGCCGLVEKEKRVYLTKHENPKTCTHVVHLAKIYEKSISYNVGIHPKSAERIARLCLEKNCIPSLNNIKDLEQEKTFLNSRFDFCGIDENGKNFVLEVKSVPCADYEDIYAKERKKRNYDSWAVDSKIAYFPDGYRKKVTDTVSPRALKHIQELEQLKITNPEMRTIILFVVQRPDVLYFQASNIDLIYKNALKKAYSSGVEVIPINILWNDEGKCYYKKILDFKS